MLENMPYFLDGLHSIGIELSQEQQEQFSLYYELLKEWNTKINLTSIIEEKEVILKHFLDSLLLVKDYPIDGVVSVMDLGTGAGFPGIPLKILYPQLQVTLMDAVNKKITFLQMVCDELKLTDMNCLHGRAEDFAKETLYREKYDLVVSRAVSNLATLSEYCIPFVKLEGYFVAYKSESYKEEVEGAKNAIHLLGGKIENILNCTLPQSDIGRTYVCIKKVELTSIKYPRKAGLPSKNPL